MVYVVFDPDGKFAAAFASEEEANHYSGMNGRIDDVVPFEKATVYNDREA
jgi:hypothetical protein